MKILYPNSLFLNPKSLGRGRRWTDSFAMLLLSSRLHQFSSFAPKITIGAVVRPVTTSLSASKDIGNETTKPLIIGGGIAGLATAVALENIAGISSQILEKQTIEEFQDEKKGAGAQIGPNGLRALKAIGGDDLMQQCIDSGSILKGNAMMLPGMPDPMILPDTTEEDTGLPQVFIRWGVLRELLANQITKSSIHTGFGENVCGYKVNEDGTIVLVADQDNDIEHGETNLIVSAEGARSIFRYIMHMDNEIIDQKEDKESLIDSRLKDTGRINLKAVVPTNLDETFLSGHTYAWFAQDGGVGCFAGPAGSGYTYWAISIADSIDETTGKTAPFPEGVDQNDFHSIKSALLNKLNDLNSTDCQFIINLVEDTTPETIYASRSVEALDIGPHLQKDDKIVLVGDSAHAMPASYGQSPNFALEDAAVLACCLRDSTTVKSALESYSEQRVSRCLEMQQRSAERAAKAMKGEQTEDVSKWIFQWDVNK